MASVEEVRQRIASVPYWHHRIELAPGIVTPGASDSPGLLAALNFPSDLTGKRALDIGANDGHFSFELEKRGAAVLAVDQKSDRLTGFEVAKDLLGSRVERLHANLFDLRPEEIGQFDIVLFLGVLYHLRDPLAGLDVVRSLSRDRMYLETHVCDVDLPCDAPILRFYPGDALNGDPTNYWGPNQACVEAMLRESEFEPLRVARDGARVVAECRAAEPGPAGYYRRVARGLLD